MCGSRVSGAVAAAPSCPDTERCSQATDGAKRVSMDGSFYLKNTHTSQRVVVIVSELI